MIKTIPFNIEHLNLLASVDGQHLELLALDNVKYALANLPGAPKAEAVTLIVEDRILACFGFTLITPGVVDVWLFPSVYVKDNAIGFVRTVNNYLEVTSKVFGWHRAQSLTRVDSIHRKWMQTLGFVEEGVMRKYYKKQDFIISARYFGGE